MAKIERNPTRYARTTAHLTELGWTVLSFWEHEPVETIAEAIIVIDNGMSIATRSTGCRDVEESDAHLLKLTPRGSGGLEQVGTLTFGKTSIAGSVQYDPRQTEATRTRRSKRKRKLYWPELEARTTRSNQVGLPGR
ncbi:hypothetical protein LJR235_002324 [Pararhizobium sp. LjRoot235]|uniref:hypothetical protein n=1 Tax=Pararhizobium sp. LjRoot235 TaxID=3342291 RepID=UPI003ED0EADD